MGAGMRIDAPYSYVEAYYANDWRLRDSFADETAFIDRLLAHVAGDVVLNAGCGPQFYDVVSRFGRAPRDYVGVDIGQETIRFLRDSQDPRFLAGRAAAEATGARFELVCHDILTWAGLTPGRFDAIVASGFIGTFHDAKLATLLSRLRAALRDGGRLIKLTWHGPHRTPEQTAQKLEYGYDSLEEHDPSAFVATIEDAGFATIAHEQKMCDARTYRWDVVQGCVFEKQ